MTDMNQWTLMTYPGISAVVVMMVGGVKKLWPKWVEGKEPTVSFALSLVLGIAAKLTMAGAYAGIQWLPHIVGLICASFGAKLIHDHLINDVIKGGDDAPAEEKK
jgi:hypothetical protein